MFLARVGIKVTNNVPIVYMAQVVMIFMVANLSQK